MATKCENYLTDITTAHGEADWELDSFLTPLQEWFQDEQYTHTTFDSDWRTHISSMVTTVESILAFLIHGNWQRYHPYRLPYYLTNCIEAKVSMRAMLDAMYTADNDELKDFIGLVDAYRQSLWNKPFDVEYWAAIARGFEQWE